MSETKKPRAMTSKMFIHRSNSSKVSASAFLQAHRQFLETGELAPLVSPILAKVDNQEVMPTPALHQIRDIVFSHLLQSNLKEEERKLAQAQANPAKVKPWLVTVYDGNGNIASHRNEEGEWEELESSFEESARADGWAHRKLFDGAPNWYAIVSHTSITIKGEPFSVRIERSDAIAAILKAPKGAVMKVTSKTTSKLGFGVKVNNDVSRFSRG